MQHVTRWRANSLIPIGRLAWKLRNTKDVWHVNNRGKTKHAGRRRYASRILHCRHALLRSPLMPLIGFKAVHSSSWLQLVCMPWLELCSILPLHVLRLWDLPHVSRRKGLCLAYGVFKETFSHRDAGFWGTIKVRSQLRDTASKIYRSACDKRLLLFLIFLGKSAQTNFFLCKKLFFRELFCFSSMPLFKAFEFVGELDLLGSVAHVAAFLCTTSFD